MKYLSVDTRQMKQNEASGKRAPTILVDLDDDGPPLTGRVVEILGPSRMVYDHDNPIPKGKGLRDRMLAARVWVETDGEVRVDGKLLP